MSAWEIDYTAISAALFKILLYRACLELIDPRTVTFEGGVVLLVSNTYRLRGDAADLVAEGLDAEGDSVTSHRYGARLSIFTV